MNPKGVNLSDVWLDIPPVRHAKYKRRDANALSLKLMDRIVSMGSDPGSLVLDPFGGSGTTYVAAELTERRWIGSELDCSPIIERFDNLEGDRQYLAEIQENKTCCLNVPIWQYGAKMGDRFRRITGLLKLMANQFAPIPNIPRLRCSNAA